MRTSFVLLLVIVSESVKTPYDLSSVESLEGEVYPVYDPGASFDDVVDLEIGEESDAPSPQVEAVLTDDTVKDYLAKAAKFGLLTAIEEVELAKAIEAGEFANEILLETEVRPESATDILEERSQRMTELQGEYQPATPSDFELDLKTLANRGHKARERLTGCNTLLVASIAKRYLGQGLTYSDLIQEGNLGLIRAVDKFDYRKGYKFSTYATWWIRQSVTRGIQDKGLTVRVPVHANEAARRCNRAIADLTQLLQRDPTDEEVAHRMKIPVATVQEYREYLREPISLDTHVADEDDIRFGDLVTDQDDVGPSGMADVSALREALDTVLATLGEREEGVMRMRFGLDGADAMTLSAIAERYGVTRERIRQIETRTLALLAVRGSTSGLRDFLRD